MILIYSEDINPRIDYITRLIFTQILGVEVSFTTNSSKFITSKWINTNRNLVCTKEDGNIVMLDYETKEIVREAKILFLLLLLMI